MSVCRNQPGAFSSARWNLELPPWMSPAVPPSVPRLLHAAPLTGFIRVSRVPFSSVMPSLWTAPVLSASAAGMIVSIQQ